MDLIAMLHRGHHSIEIMTGSEAAHRGTTAKKAIDGTGVSLISPMLDFASKFMDKEDDAERRRIIQKLKNRTIHRWP